jgi:hypothetical protein
MMAALWTVPGTNHFVIGTDRDKMNLSDWVVSIVNLSTGDVSDETSNVTVEEIVQTIDSPASGTVSADTAAGSKILPLSKDDGANFKPGMKVKVATVDGDEYKEIRKVSGDTLIFFKPLKANVVSDTDDDGEADNKVDQVGNTGDYRVIVDSTSLSSTLVAGGDYQVQVTSESGEIDVTSEIFHAIDYDFDDVKDDMNYLKQGIDNLINGGLGGARIYL